MEDLIEFRRPDGSTYFAKFPENESDKLVLPEAQVSPKFKFDVWRYLLVAGLVIYFFSDKKK
jgi:hypothetical protein